MSDIIMAKNDADFGNIFDYLGNPLKFFGTPPDGSDGIRAGVGDFTLSSAAGSSDSGFCETGDLAHRAFSAFALACMIPTFEMLDALISSPDSTSAK
jgi:hypothetical protein